MYQLVISNAAQKFINELGEINFQNNYAIVIVDTHCCGGMLLVEIHYKEMIAEDKNMELLFSKDETGNSFDVYVECQALREDSLPEQILIDLNQKKQKKQLEIKNGRFEKPYSE